MRNLSCLLVTLIALLPAAASAQKKKDKPQPIPIAKVERSSLVDFEKDILPIFKRNCTACHSKAVHESDLLLETPQTILKGGDSGPAVVAGKSAESLLLKAASHTGDTIMPPPDNDVEARNLTPQELGLIKLWIDQGATGNVSGGTGGPLEWQPLPPGVNPILAVSITADGQYVACGRANQIFIYHVPTGQLLTRLSDEKLQSSGQGRGVAHLDMVESLAFNPAGDLLASGSFREVKLWRRPSNVRRFNVADAAAGKAQAVATSPDGKWLAVGGDDNKIKLFSLADGKPARTLEGHAGAITGLTFTPDSAKLYSSSKDKTVRSWNVADGKLLSQLITATEANGVALLQKGAQLVTANQDNLLRQYNLAEPVKNLAGVPSPATCLATNADKRLLAVGGADGKVAIVETANGKVTKTFDAHPGGVTEISISQDGSKLATVGADKQVKVWNVAEAKPLVMLTPPETNPTAVAINNGGNFVAAGEENGKLTIWKLDGAPADKPVEPLGSNTDHGKKITGMVFSPDGNSLYSCGEDGNVRGFNTGDAKQKFAANHGAPINDLAMSPNGQWLASAGANNQVRVWNAGNGSNGPKPELGGFTQPVRSVAFTKDNNYVVGAGAEVLVFHVNEGLMEQGYAALGGAITALDAAGEQTPLFIAASEDKSVKLLSYGLIRRIAGHGGPVTCVATISDNQFLSGSQDSTVRHWNADNGQQIRQMNHGGPVTSVAVRPDAKRFASASSNNTAKLWNADNGQQIAELKGDYRAYRQVAGLEQDINKFKQKIDADKKVLAKAEQDLPKADAMFKKTEEALKKATDEANKKAEEFKKVEAEKQAADKKVAETATAKQKAEAEQKQANEALAKAQEAAKQAAQKAQQAKQQADNNKDDKNLAKAAEDAQKASDAAAEAAKKADEVKKAADAKLNEANKAAQEADAKVKSLQKPFDDGQKAVNDTNAAKQKAEREHKDSMRDLDKIKELIPGTKQSITGNEGEQKRLEGELATAKQRVADNEKPIQAVAFSLDGNYLATGGDNQVVYTWSADNGTALDAFDGHKGPVLAAAFGPDHTLITGAGDKSAAAWDIAPDWVLERRIGDVDKPDQFIDRVLSLDFSPDGQILATGSGEPSRSGEVKLWKVADGTLIREIPDAHSDTVFGLDFSPDGKLLATCAADKFMKVFNVADGKFVRSFEGHTHHVLGVSWRANGEELSTCGADEVIKVWNSATGEQIRTQRGFGKQITSISYIGELDQTLASSGDKTVRIQRTNSNNVGNVRTFGGATDYVYSSACTPDGKIVVAGGHDSVLRVWNGTNGQVIGAYEAPKPPEKNVVAEK